MAKYTVYIGRFQPFHNGHLETVKQALTQSDHLIILIGSAFSAPTIRNPFSWELRRDMISATLNAAGYQNKFTLLPMRDYFYSDNAWVAAVQEKVGLIIGPADTVALVGFNKDCTSYYLKLFPKWVTVYIEKTKVLDATTIRYKYYTLGDWHADISEQTAVIMAGTSVADLRKFLVDEWNCVEGYMSAWAQSPYEPTFVTTDGVVICGGHVLLVKRKGFPGKGQLALPGGFVDKDEKLDDCVIREVREETRIAVPPAVLAGSVKRKAVFDHPLRSVCGRRITHAYYIQLKEKTLPRVKGADDAEKAFWMPLAEVNRKMDQFFEDHFQIIESFVGRL
jgi:bifunctional NMN adenylyltransferase/nudix hydrolase